MRTVLVVLMVLAMLGVLASLFGGMVGLVRGGGDPRRSNRLMRYRIIFQGLALLLVGILLSLWR